ncbi:unnamed protein product [Blepharisma stoltei]|uniref:Uncharacterized protein n=1 Tax=Blepharisma stoltei TaxID=1481888 RepID=A0AAU9IKI2_9CILI|nr:unnamed protein product [Blepharisma stoltei]
MEYFTNRSGLQLTYSISIKYPNVQRIYIICPMWPTEIFFLSEFIYENLDANVFKFYLTGTGSSQGENTYAGNLRDADDIDDAVKFLIERGYSVEGIIGNAKFGTSAIIYSAIYGDVKTIISLSPKYDFSLLPPFIKDNYESIRINGEIIHTALGKEWKCTWNMIQEMMSLDMKYYCHKAKGSIYIIQGDQDQICPFADSIEFERELKEKCRGRFVLNCDEFFIGVFDEVVEIIEKIIYEN